MAKTPKLLLCDDDSLIHMAVKERLKGSYECRSAYNSDEATVILRKDQVDLLLLDIQIRTPDEGLRALKKFREMDGELPIVMMSGLNDFAHVREALRAGATDYVVKDLEHDELPHVLERVLRKRELEKRNEQQNLEVTRHQRKHVMVGDTAPIIALRKTLERLTNSPANVVIYGETGTGKEVVARNLRKQLPDGSFAPFVAVDSATIQSSTAESLLFGHEKGAFTGAEKATKGIFEEADGGIVYFDEIANMPLEIQAKLLRVLQEKEVTRLGSSRVIPLEFRVVCATNKDLEAMVKAGTFKDDLLQRLNVIPLSLPPLRERPQDIPLLVEHFASQQTGIPGLRFSAEALELLQSYPWPGNVRELANVVSFVAAMSDGPEILPADLPPKFRDAANAAQARKSGAQPATGSASFYDRVSSYEKDLLSEEYARFDGNVSKMALGLGMDRSHLHAKLKEHRIHAPRQTTH